MSKRALQVYRSLYRQLGAQQWWPAESPFEVMVGAVLVQNTAWKNVERAIANLKEAGLLDPQRLVDVDPSRLEQLLRPAGYFRVKTRRLQSLVGYFLERYRGSIEAMRKTSARQLREELLAVHGIGPETADDILLYAANKPEFVVDAYTRRIWARHGWIGFDASYDELKRQLADELPRDVNVLQEMHALLVRVGKEYCRGEPRCDECPLQGMLPRCGIVALP